MNPKDQDTVETERDTAEPPPQVETSDAPPEDQQPEARAETPSIDSTTSDEVSEAKPTDAAKPEDKPGKKAKPRKSAQDRIDQVTFERRRAEAERDYWRNRALDLERTKPAAGDLENKPAERPREEDFDTHDDYIEALVDWKAEQRQSKAPSSQPTNGQQPERLAGETVAKWNVARLRGIEQHEDFDSVCGNPSLQITPTMIDAAVGGELGDEVIYHLGKNPAEAARIAALDVTAQQREILKLEDTLKAGTASDDEPAEEEATTAPDIDTEPANKLDDLPGNEVAAPSGGKPAASSSHPKRKVTNAPPPSKPIPGSGGAQSAVVDLGKVQSQEEYEAARRRGVGGQSY